MPPAGIGQDRERVLIDTNVFIEREGPHEVPESLRELLNKLRLQGHSVVVHPESKQEVRNYEYEEGRARGESKIATYEELSFPPYPKEQNTEFRSEVPPGENYNEKVDNALLFAVYKDRVDYLITWDSGLQEKAERLGLDDVVLSPEKGCGTFSEEDDDIPDPPPVTKTTMGELSLDDPILDSLREDYPEFDDWFNQHRGGDAWVNYLPNGTLGAVLFLKPNEAEELGGDPVLPKRDRLKIRTFKVGEPHRGSKLGELLINIAIREAIQHELDEIYLTRYIKDPDYLVQLISDYGFQKASEEENGEAIFVKRLTPGMDDDPGPFETHYRFYPSFHDGPQVTKYLVPIQPDYHRRLFPTYDKRNPTLDDFTGPFISEGNAIKKAYLSHSNIKQIEPSDILLFYRSHDHQELTSLGVCERVHTGLTDADKIKEIVEKRTVYSGHDIDSMANSETLVLLFKWHFDLGNPISYAEMIANDVVAGPIQSITKIDESSYKYIRRNGGIDERFIVD